MNNIDGTTNQTGLVRHYYDFRLKMGEQETIQHFYIGGIGMDRFILGFPWLQEFNPPINWTKKKVEGPHLTVSTTNRTLEQEAAERLKIEAAIWGNTVTIPRVDCSYVFLFFMLTNPSPRRLPSPCMTPVDDM